MASPKRPEPGYGYSMPLQASPDYPQYPQPTAPYNPQPFDINSLFRLLGGTAPQTASGGTGGVGGPAPAVMPVGPAQPLPLASMPVGSVAPPMAPQPAGSMDDPYSTSTSRDFGFVDGRPPQAPQAPQMGGTNVSQLLAVLRAMQGKGQTLAPQAPYIPDYTMPVPEMTPAETAMNRALRIAREAEKARIEGVMPRMPQGREGAPRIGPSPTMRGSGMGLEGILRGIEASRGSR